MVVNKKHFIYEYAYKALNDFISFAKFVSYAENIDQIKELFKDEKSKEKYQQIWFELEIINASALSDWEDDGRPVDWQIRWESSYKQDAARLLNELLDTLK